ncbi:hypothetical protein IFJ82_15575 (plasmid) [Novacetimonas hansenii]|uniref:hypothetical protein n=1 Tax=Novacetimonas hansenii TaxID=436 RepID=UPI001780AA50|nr:hypothetical protein [Novacetimonas hansenii]QOF96877.1 hypothetical protein IFJ82_15575 [Novacetimonas hansenii]
MIYLLPHLREACIVTESASGLLGASDAISVVRELTLQRITRLPEENQLGLHVAGVDRPLQINANRTISFGSGPRESVSVHDYIKRVMEIGDLIDVAVLPGQPYTLDSFWMNIVYEGNPSSFFVRKDDGLFAYRAKSGEKAERRVGRDLRDKAGHPFPDVMLQPPGPFIIRYGNKRQRKPDLRCPRCGLLFEVKKRNADWKYRVSHSAERPFASENAPSGWHAFVFPDYKINYLPNRAIAEAIDSGHARIEKDRYDSYAELDPYTVRPSPPPPCLG